MIESLLSEEDRIAIEKGIRCEALLANPTFAETINSLSDEYSNAIINTSPKESERREQLYYLHRALTDIVGQLHQAVVVRQETETRLQAEEAAEQLNKDNF